MNNDIIFIFFTIFIVTAAIYILYKIMLGSDKKEKEIELQITSKELLAQLNILYRQKKYNIVESLARNYLNKKGNNEDVRIILTKALYASGKSYEAVEEAKTVINQQPLNYSMRIFLANCYLEMEKTAKAITVFEEILKEDSENIIAIKELAKIYLKTNQKISAVKMYTKLEDLLENNQEKVKNKIIIAEIHAELQEFDLAVKQYEEILEIYPEDLNTKKRLVELYNLNSDYEPLIIIANDLAEKYPDNQNGLWAMEMLMFAYKSMKNYEKALELAKLIQNHPLADKVNAGKNIAGILFGQGNLDESIQILNDLLAKDPNNIELRKMLAKIYESKQDFETAVDIYNKILDIENIEAVQEINFEISNLYSDWAIKLFSEGRNDECFKHFSKALSYCDKNPYIYYQLGNVNKKIKNFNEAISQYKAAIELDPKNADYYYAVSECYEEIDSIYEQKKMLVECLKYNHENTQAHYKLGNIYNLQNDPNNAKIYYRKAIKTDSAFTPAKYKLALLLEHTGDSEGAIRLYKEILVLEPENENVLNNLKMLT